MSVIVDSQEWLSIRQDHDQATICLQKLRTLLLRSDHDEDKDH